MSDTSERERLSRLLIVEDDPAQLRTLTSIMQKEGFEVIGTSTAAEAMKRIKCGDVGVAVVDLRLPDLSGTQLLGSINALNDKVRVIINTAFGSFGSAKDALNLGAIAYVEKAGDPDELVRHVHAAFRWHLDRYAKDLEETIAERTTELRAANEALRADLAERRQVEEELGRYRHDLEDLVSERTRELAASQDQLRQAERLASIGTLAAGVAHAINNPVGVILLAAENASALTEEPDAAARIDRSLDKIVENAKRCGGIVKSILQFAKQGTTRKWPNDLNAILRHAAEVTRSYVEDPDVVIGLELDPDLPKVVVNPIEIEQVFANLIRNSIEAGDSNNRIKIVTARGPAAVHVRIEDRGCGLTQKQQERLFDPFYTTRREHGGVGLGLSITHGIVTEHGGTIDVQSQPGQGTTVTVSLPFEAGSERSGAHVKSTDR